MREKGLALKKIDGFTLIELLVALAVGGVLLIGAVAGIYQLLVTTGRGSNQVVSLTDINQAALAIKRDLLMAQATDLSSTPQSSANLTWIDYTTSFGSANQTNHSSAYTLSGKQLRRTYDGTVSIVGRNVTSISFTQIEDAQGKFVTVVISTSNTTPPSQIETLKFSSHIRAEALQ